MKAYKFITTFSNVQKKFDVVAYPKELMSALAKVKQSTIYTKVQNFGGSQPVKYKIFESEGFRFYSKILFLGSQDIEDYRGDNYIATTIVIGENNRFNPARLFRDTQLWSESITEQEDQAFANNPFLPAFEIELPDNKYEFLAEYLGSVHPYSFRLLQLIDLLITRREKDILLNSSLEDYSTLFFLTMDVLPDEFTKDSTVTLHAGDPDRETANLIETVLYGPNKLNLHSKRFTILDYYNAEAEVIKYREGYLHFLQKNLDGFEKGIEKIRGFNSLYDHLQFDTHTMDSLNFTAGIWNGNLKKFFAHTNKRKEIALDKIGQLLITNQLVSLSEWLENFLDSISLSERNTFFTYINHAISFADHHGFSLMGAISIYEKKFNITPHEFTSLIQSYCKHPFSDAPTALELLLSIRLIKGQDAEAYYTESLIFLYQNRPDLFELDSPLKGLWEEYKEGLEIKESDNKGFFLKKFREHLQYYGKAKNQNKPFQTLKMIFQKPWNQKSLKKALKILKSEVPKKEMIAAFIFDFLTYLQRESDSNVPDVAFLLRHIIDTVAERDPALLRKLCAYQGGKIFTDTLRAEIQNRFTKEEAEKYLSPANSPAHFTMFGK